MKKKFKQFPGFLFIAEHGEPQERWLSANKEAIDCLEDNGPELVATYQLVEVNKLSKRVKSEPA